MGQTPIYDQLRGERINADVPATGTYPTGQPAGEGGRAAPVWGPRAGLSLAVHARQAPAHAAGSSPALPAASHNSAAPGAAAGNRGGHRAGEGGPRPVPHTEPRPITPADPQFPWFDDDHD